MNHRLRSCLSTLLSLSLLLTSLSLPDIARAAHEPSRTPDFVQQLQIPRELGMVTDSYSSDKWQVASGKREASAVLSLVTCHLPQVVLIQDLHLHYPTQKKIFKILEQLDAKGFLQEHLAVEGTSGTFDTTRLAAFPSSPLKDQLVDYFMKKGELSGDEAFSVLKNRAHLLYGVDDAKLYGLNRSLYKESLLSRKELDQRLEQIRQLVQILKKANYPRALKRLDQEQAYDVRSAEELLEKKLAAVGSDRLSRSDPSRRTLLTNLIQIDHSLNYLTRLLRQEVTIEETRYIAQRLPQFVELTEKLLNTQKAPSLSSSPAVVSGGSMDPGLRPAGMTALSGNLAETLKSSIDFYAVALMRDKPLAENTLALLKSDKWQVTSGKKQATSGRDRSSRSLAADHLPPATCHLPLATVVLVAGGFHTAGITKELKAAGVSYAVITPMVEDIDKGYHDLYEKRVADQHVTVEEIARDFNVSEKVLSASYSISNARKGSDYLQRGQTGTDGQTPLQVSDPSRSLRIPTTLLNPRNPDWTAATRAMGYKGALFLPIRKEDQIGRVNHVGLAESVEIGSPHFFSKIAGRLLENAQFSYQALTKGRPEFPTYYGPDNQLAIYASETEPSDHVHYVFAQRGPGYIAYHKPIVQALYQIKVMEQPKSLRSQIAGDLFTLPFIHEAGHSVRPRASPWFLLLPITFSLSFVATLLVSTLHPLIVPFFVATLASAMLYRQWLWADINEELRQVTLEKDFVRQRKMDLLSSSPDAYKAYEDELARVSGDFPALSGLIQRWRKLTSIADIETIDPPKAKEMLMEMALQSLGVKGPRNIRAISPTGGAMPAAAETGTPASGFAQQFNRAQLALKNQRVRDFIVKELAYNYGQFELDENFVNRLVDTLAEAQPQTLEEVHALLRQHNVDLRTDPFQSAYAKYRAGDKHDVIWKQVNPYIPNNGVVLDLGAGDARFSNYIKSKSDKVKKLYAYETPTYKRPNTEMADGVEWLTGIEVRDAAGHLTGYRIPLEDKSVDTVFMNAVMHHVPPEGLPFFFQEIARVLKNDGRLLIMEDTFPGKEKPYSVLATNRISNPELAQEYLAKINQELTDDYKGLSEEEESLFLTFNDFYSNVIVQGHNDFSFPFNFRSIQEWTNLIEPHGFTPYPNDHRFLGFTEGRFHQPGTGILVFDREDPQVRKTKEDLLAILNNPNWEGDIRMDAEFMTAFGESIRWYIDRLFKSTAGVRGVVDLDMNNLMEDVKDLLGGRELNAAVILFVAQTYADYINANYPTTTDGHDIEKAAFVGYDERHFSKEFADIFTRVFLANGIKVYRDYLDGKYISTATPVSSNAAFTQRAATAIEITASHNPRNQTGVKSQSWTGGVDIDSISDQIANSARNLYAQAEQGQGIIHFAAFKDETIQRVDAKELYYRNQWTRLFTAKKMREMQEYIIRGKERGHPAKFNFDALWGVGGFTLRYYLDRMIEDYGLDHYVWYEALHLMNDTPNPNMGFLETPDPSRAETLELSGALAELISDLDYKASVSADQDSDRMGTASVIPDDQVAKAQKLGLFVSGMSPKNQPDKKVQIVRFTANQQFTLNAYGIALQAVRDRMTAKGYQGYESLDEARDAIVALRAGKDGSANGKRGWSEQEQQDLDSILKRMVLVTTVPTSMITKGLMQWLGGTIVNAAVGFKYLGDMSYQIDHKKDRWAREDGEDWIILSILEESGGAQIGPSDPEHQFVEVDGHRMSIMRDKDTLTEAMEIFYHGARLNAEDKNMLDFYDEMAENLGGKYYYERLDAYLPNKEDAESQNPAIRTESDRIKTEIAGRATALETMSGQALLDLFRPVFGEAVSLATTQLDYEVEDVTFLLQQEDGAYGRIPPRGRLHTMSNGWTMQIFHIGLAGKEGPAIRIFDELGKEIVRTCFRVSGTESLVRLYMEVFEPNQGGDPHHLITYFEPLINYLGLQGYYLHEESWYKDPKRNKDLKAKRRNYYEGHIDSIQTKYPKDASLPGFATASHNPVRTSGAMPVRRPAAHRPGIVATALAAIVFILNLFSVSTESLAALRTEFSRQILAGVAGKPESLKTFDSHLTAPVRHQTSLEAIGVDTGGSTIRAFRYRVQPDGRVVKLERIERPISEHEKKLPAKELFAIIAETVAQLTLKADRQYPLGLTFSFPVSQTGPASGIVTDLTKGFTTPELVGKDPADLLREALVDQGLTNTPVMALMNDTVATQVASAYLYPDTVGALIYATGKNISILYQGKIYNLESGGFNYNGIATVQTEFDHLIDAEWAKAQGKQLAEKMISGLYMGEIVRQIVAQRTDLFPGWTNVKAFQPRQDPENDPYNLDTGKHLSPIAADKTKDLSGIQGLLEKLGISNSTLEQRLQLQAITNAVAKRSALLAANTVAAAIQTIDPEDVMPSYTFAVDGSVYDGFPGIKGSKGYFRAALEEALGQERAAKLTIRMIKDASSKGPAVKAAQHFTDLNISEKTFEEAILFVKERVFDNSEPTETYYDEQSFADEIGVDHPAINALVRLPSDSNAHWAMLANPFTVDAVSRFLQKARSTPEGQRDAWENQVTIFDEQVRRATQQNGSAPAAGSPFIAWKPGEKPSEQAQSFVDGDKTVYYSHNPAVGVTAFSELGTFDLPLNNRLISPQYLESRRLGGPELENLLSALGILNRKNSFRAFKGHYSQSLNITIIPVDGPVTFFVFDGKYYHSVPAYQRTTPEGDREIFLSRDYLKDPHVRGLVHVLEHELMHLAKPDASEATVTAESIMSDVRAVLESAEKAYGTTLAITQARDLVAVVLRWIAQDLAVPGWEKNALSFRLTKIADDLSQKAYAEGRKELLLNDVSGSIWSWVSSLPAALRGAMPAVVSSPAQKDPHPAVYEELQNIVNRMPVEEIETLLSAPEFPLPLEIFGNVIVLSGHRFPDWLRGKRIAIPEGVTEFTRSPLVMWMVMRRLLVRAYLTKSGGSMDRTKWDFLFKHIDNTPRSLGIGGRGRFRAVPARLTEIADEVHQQAYELVNNTEVIPRDVEEVVFVGMGGSAVSGDVLNGILQAVGAGIRVTVCKDFNLPSDVLARIKSGKVLVILSSFSGTTGETVKIANDLQADGVDHVLAVSSGEGAALGRVVANAQAAGLSWTFRSIIETGALEQPREAFPISLFKLRAIFQEVLIRDGKTAAANKLGYRDNFFTELMQNTQESFEPRAQDMAMDLYEHGKILVLVTDEDPVNQALGIRFSQQFAECPFMPSVVLTKKQAARLNFPDDRYKVVTLGKVNRTGATKLEELLTLPDGTQPRTVVEEIYAIETLITHLAYGITVLRGIEPMVVPLITGDGSRPMRPWAYKAFAEPGPAHEAMLTRFNNEFPAYQRDFGVTEDALVKSENEITHLITTASHLADAVRVQEKMLKKGKVAQVIVLPEGNHNWDNHLLPYFGINTPAERIHYVLLLDEKEMAENGAAIPAWLKGTMVYFLNPMVGRFHILELESGTAKRAMPAMKLKQPIEHAEHYRLKIASAGWIPIAPGNSMDRPIDKRFGRRISRGSMGGNFMARHLAMDDPNTHSQVKAILGQELLPGTDVVLYSGYLDIDNIHYEQALALSTGGSLHLLVTHPAVVHALVDSATKATRQVFDRNNTQEVPGITLSHNSREDEDHYVKLELGRIQSDSGALLAARGGAFVATLPGQVRSMRGGTVPVETKPTGMVIRGKSLHDRRAAEWNTHYRKRSPTEAPRELKRMAWVDVDELRPEKISVFDPAVIALNTAQIDINKILSPLYIEALNRYWEAKPAWLRWWETFKNFLSNIPTFIFLADRQKGIPIHIFEAKPTDIPLFFQSGYGQVRLAMSRQLELAIMRFYLRRLDQVKKESKKGPDSADEIRAATNASIIKLMHFLLRHEMDHKRFWRLPRWVPFLGITADRQDERARIQNDLALIRDVMADPGVLEILVDEDIKPFRIHLERLENIANQQDRKKKAAAIESLVDQAVAAPGQVRAMPAGKPEPTVEQCDHLEQLVREFFAAYNHAHSIYHRSDAEHQASLRMLDEASYRVSRAAREFDLISAAAVDYPERLTYELLKTMERLKQLRLKAASPAQDNLLARSQPASRQQLKGTSRRASGAMPAAVPANQGDDNFLRIPFAYTPGELRYIDRAKNVLWLPISLDADNQSRIDAFFPGDGSVKATYALLGQLQRGPEMIVRKMETEGDSHYEFYGFLRNGASPQSILSDNRGIVHLASDFLGIDPQSVSIQVAPFHIINFPKGFKNEAGEIWYREPASAVGVVRVAPEDGGLAMPLRVREGKPPSQNPGFVSFGIKPYDKKAHSIHSTDSSFGYPEVDLVARTLGTLLRKFTADERRAIEPLLADAKFIISQYKEAEMTFWDGDRLVVRLDESLFKRSNKVLLEATLRKVLINLKHLEKVKELGYRETEIKHALPDFLISVIDSGFSYELRRVIIASFGTDAMPLAQALSSANQFVSGKNSEAAHWNKSAQEIFADSSFRNTLAAICRRCVEAAEKQGLDFSQGLLMPLTMAQTLPLSSLGTGRLSRPQAFLRWIASAFSWRALERFLIERLFGYTEKRLAQVKQAEQLAQQVLQGKSFMPSSTASRGLLQKMNTYSRDLLRLMSLPKNRLTDEQQRQMALARESLWKTVSAA